MYTTLVPTLSAVSQNVTVLSSQSTVLQCMPSNPNLSLRWELYQNDGTKIPITSTLGDIVITKRNIQQPPSLDIVTSFPYHSITIINADVSYHSGVYVCSIETPRGDDTVISRSITVNVLPGKPSQGFLIL